MGFIQIQRYVPTQPILNANARFKQPEISELADKITILAGASTSYRRQKDGEISFMCRRRIEDAWRCMLEMLVGDVQDGGASRSMSHCVWGAVLAVKMTETLVDRTLHQTEPGDSRQGDRLTKLLSCKHLAARSNVCRLYSLFVITHMNLHLTPRSSSIQPYGGHL